MINWQNRYAKIINRNRELLNHARSILEVGAGLHGIAEFLKRPVTGIDTNVEGQANKWLNLQKGDVLDIQFPDDSFDFVICVDVLEHIPHEKRLAAITEMLRVTKERLIISCPCDSLSNAFEIHLSNMLKSIYGVIPDWLSEHLKNGLPSVKDILGNLKELGREFSIIGNEGIMQHYSGILLDMQFAEIKGLYELHSSKSVFAPPIGESEWDRYYSFIFEIDKQKVFQKKEGIPSKHDSKSLTVNPPKSAIYSVSHKELHTDFLGKITPIVAGKAAESANDGVLTDRLVSYPSLLNTRWSELSAIYKIWKEGPHTEIVGFTHYRRYFDFSGENIDVDRVDVSLFELETKYCNNIYDQEFIDRLCTGGIAVAKPVKMEVSIWVQYCRVHNTNDWCWIISKISRDYPYLLKFALEQFDDNSLYAYNMFISHVPPAKPGACFVNRSKRWF